MAGWRREGPVPRWPDPAGEAGAAGEPVAAAETGPFGETDPTGETDPARDAALPSRSPHPHNTAKDLGDEDHFVPPEPPPLPRLGPPAAVGLGLLTLGLLLVISPEWFGMSSLYGLPLGLLTLAAGLGWLVLRLWPTSPPPGDGDGEDDGAVL